MQIYLGNYQKIIAHQGNYGIIDENGELYSLKLKRFQVF